MPNGLQVFSADSKLQVDLTSRLGSILTIFEINNNGSQSFPESAGRELFATYLPIYPGGVDAFPTPAWTAPAITIDQVTKTVSWAYYTVGTATRNRCFLIVGMR